MPLPIALAHRLAQRLAEVRKAELLPYLRPDGKTQVTVRYRDGVPVAIEKVLISTQHREGVDSESLIKPDLFEHVLAPVLPARPLRRGRTAPELPRQPDGPVRDRRPGGDCGLTGRKIIVDTYGGMARHGGGAFSRQGPVEGRPQRRVRGAARGQERGRRGPGRPRRGPGRLRDRRRASGVGDGRDVRDREGRRARRSRRSIDEHFDLRPGAFRESLRLHRPIYQKTAAYGHFGREDDDFTWETTDKADALRQAAGLGALAATP